MTTCSYAYGYALLSQEWFNCIFWEGVVPLFVVLIIFLLIVTATVMFETRKKRKKK